jgi:hypothetical protein
MKSEVPDKEEPKQAPATQAVSKNTNYGKHATMPVLAADQYAQVILPELLPFKPEDIKLDGTVVACGKRRTGKSWVFRNLMYLMKDKIPAGIVISQTDELNKFWRQYIPAKYIYPKYEPEILDAVFFKTKKDTKRQRTNRRREGQKSSIFHFVRRRNQRPTLEV